MKPREMRLRSGSVSSNPWYGPESATQMVESNLYKNRFEELPAELLKKIVGDSGLPPKFKLVRFGVHDDGNCWYDTMAAIHNYKGVFESMSVAEQISLGREFRAHVLKHMVDQGPHAWAQFWEARGVSQDYIPSIHEMEGKMANHRTWAELFAIVYTFANTNTNVIFFDMESGGKPYCGVTAPQKCKSCLKNWSDLPDGEGALGLVAWVNRSHFEPIMLFLDNVSDADYEKMCAELGRRNVYRRGRDVFISKLKGRLAEQILQMYETKACANVSLASIARTNSAIVAGVLRRGMASALEQSRMPVISRPKKTRIVSL